MDERARFYALVEGHVQGVGFRYFVMETASRLNITGWVRNTFDGNVELTAEGFRADLDELLEIIGRGPRGSFVTNVNSRWDTPSGAYDQFSILPTG